MAKAALIGGNSGSGKSASIENLKREETFVIKSYNKDFPFRHKGFTMLTKENPTGNLVVTDKTPVIVNTLNYINAQRPEIKVVVVDDFQFVSSFEFMRRTKETGYTKFTDIGKNLFDIVTLVASLRDDLIVIFMNHLDVEKDEFGGTISKAKTIGKMLDNYLTLEGLFTIVLYATVDPSHKSLVYGFETKNDGTNTVKTPKGMFDDSRIPNDLQFVVEKINEYYE